MGRILAIDYGQKRVGLAVTDPEQIIATGLDTVNANEIMLYLKQYCENEAVSTFLVGEPRQMNDTPSESAKIIEAFVAKLSKQFPNIPVQRFDERFTSKMAFQTMIDGGLKKKQRQNKALVDQISAVILLQSYMNYLSNINNRKP